MERVDDQVTWEGADGAVVLDVVVGEGQTGSIRVRVDGEEVASGPDRLSGIPLGDADGLRGKTVRVTSVVTRENPLSARTSLACTFGSAGTGMARVTSGSDTPVGGGVRFRVDVQVT